MVANSLICLTANNTEMQRKPLSFWQMWNLSFGFFGVQIAYALQSANISRIFATLGADPHQLSFFWILPPLMGMIVQPLIGKWSDRTWCRMGRRKPYLLLGAIVAVLVMAFLPNAGSLNFSSRLFLGLNGAMWFGLFSLMLLDTSINVAMQPFDVETIRREFPILSRQVYGKPLVYLDSGATAQKPQCVIDKVASLYRETNANIHRGVHLLSEEATEQFEAARAEKIYLRYFPKERIDNYLRITIGTREEMERLLAFLREYLGR